MQKLRAMLQDRAEPCMLLDVRSVEEFSAGHIPEAVHIPLESLTDAARAGTLDDWKDGGCVAIICRSGMRAAQVSSRWATACWLRTLAIALHAMSKGCLQQQAMHISLQYYLVVSANRTGKLGDWKGQGCVATIHVCAGALHGQVLRVIIPAALTQPLRQLQSMVGR